MHKKPEPGLELDWHIIRSNSRPAWEGLIERWLPPGAAPMCHADGSMVLYPPDLLPPDLLPPAFQFPTLGWIDWFTPVLVGEQIVAYLVHNLLSEGGVTLSLLMHPEACS